MQDLIIKGEIVEMTRMTHEEFLIDLAVYLYDKGRLSMGGAKELAGLNRIAFQRELAKRGVYLNYDEEEYRKDLETIKKLGL